MFRSVFISPGVPVQQPCRRDGGGPGGSAAGGVSVSESVAAATSEFRNVGWSEWLRSPRDQAVADWHGRCIEFRQEATMLWTIALILLVLWALGLVSSVTMGGFIHLLLVAAVVLVLVRLIQGRRVV
jgi:hypothetical protein